MQMKFMTNIVTCGASNTIADRAPLAAGRCACNSLPQFITDCSMLIISHLQEIYQDLFIQLIFLEHK